MAMASAARWPAEKGTVPFLLTQKSGQSPRWWREWEFWAVLLLAGMIYFPRLATPELSGEEHCRGQVAREMIGGGDWIVPRAQGLPLLSRPPVQNWAIAAFALARGDVRCVVHPPSQRASTAAYHGTDIRFRADVSLPLRRALGRGRLSHDGPGAAIRLAGRDGVALHARRGRLAHRLAMGRTSRRQKSRIKSRMSKRGHWTFDIRHSSFG